MKKILITILTTAIALCANAKTIEELVVELDNAKASSSKFIGFIHDEVYFANVADVEAMYESWKKTNVARFTMTESEALKKEDFARTPQQRKIDSTRNALCGRHIVNNELYDDAGRASLTQATYRSAKYYKANKAEWYTDLKAKDFVVDGYRLTNKQILLIASVFDDFDTALKTPLPKNVDVVVIEYFLGKFLKWDDVASAYNKCEEVLGILCEQGKTKTALYVKLEGVSKRLANRMIINSVKK